MWESVNHSNTESAIGSSAPVASYEIDYPSSNSIQSLMSLSTFFLLQ